MCAREFSDQSGTDTGKRGKADMRGGKREGAGRKPRGTERRVTFSCRVRPDTLRAVTELSADTGIGRGETVDLLVRWFLEDSRMEGREFSDGNPA